MLLDGTLTLSTAQNMKCQMSWDNDGWYVCVWMQVSEWVNVGDLNSKVLIYGTAKPPHSFPPFVWQNTTS